MRRVYKKSLATPLVLEYRDWAVGCGVNRNQIEASFPGGFLHWGYAVESQYLRAFRTQKAQAKFRKIGWELSFDQWLAWWGSDIDRRGSGRDDLQMQRFADTGPYALGNIRKGAPARNSKTFGAMERNRAAARAKEQLNARMDAMMWAPSAPDYDADSASDEETTASCYGNRLRTSFPGAPVSKYPR